MVINIVIPANYETQSLITNRVLYDILCCIVLYAFMFWMALPPSFPISFISYPSFYVLTDGDNGVGHRAYSTMQIWSGEQLTTDVQE